MTATEWAHLDPSPDPIIERYKADVDRTLIRENLRKSHEERLLTLQRMQGFVDESPRSQKDDSAFLIIESQRLLESLIRTKLVAPSPRRGALECGRLAAALGSAA